MKQVVQDLRSGATQVLEVAKPKAGAGFALVQTEASVLSVGTERMLVEFAGQSLLGKARSRPDLVRRTLQKARQEGLLSTLDSIRNRLDTPMPLGYASAGTIVEVGEDLEGFKVGDRVACGGGYAAHAEFSTIPANLMARVPKVVSAEEAAFTTLGAIALHGFRLSEARLGERVAVIGLGVLGQLAASIARAAGCQVCGIDLAEHRVGVAEQRGIQAFLRENAREAAISQTQGHGFDAVLVCADTESADPLELAGQIARDRASVILVGVVGMQLSRRLFYEKELRFQVSRSYGPGRYDPIYEEFGYDYPPGYVRWTENRNFQAFLDMLAAQKITVDDLITHRFPIEQAPQAYQQITEDGALHHLGVLLTYPVAIREYPPERRATLKSRVHRTDAEVQLGVLGAGQFATAVGIPAAAKLPEVSLVGIASGSGLSATQAGRRFGFQYNSADEQELFEDEQINTLAIFTRHHLHARQTAAALTAGKHVFCEKPLAITSQDLRAIEQALENATGLLTVGFNRRFAPLAVELKERFQSIGGPYAMLYRINAGPLPVDHWLNDAAQGGGRLLGEVCHFIDFLTFLAGESPESVRVISTEKPGSPVEENFTLLFTYPDGSTGTIAYLANGDRSLPKERVEIFGSGQVAILDDFRQLEIYREGKKHTTRSYLRQDKGHAAIWRAFVEAIREGAPPPIPYSQVLGVTQATLAALQSLRENRTLELATLAPSSIG